MEGAEIGIIGGTGVYNPDLLEDPKDIKVYTPYGSTSDTITVGHFQGRRVAIISRHSRSHTIPPHRINFRANIYALKEFGVERVFATCACGSLKEHMRPGDMVIVDQFIDFGKAVHTFFDEGRFYHVSLAYPFCTQMNGLLADCAKSLGIPVHEKGTYLKIDGPQFSTIASSRMYRQFADIIGMTGVPEAILCREKEMCFSIIATITDYDVWIEKPTPFEEMKKVMALNLDNTKRVLEKAIKTLPKERTCSCKDALKGAEA